MSGLCKTHPVWSWWFPCRWEVFRWSQLYMRATGKQWWLAPPSGNQRMPWSPDFRHRRRRQLRYRRRRLRCFPCPHRGSRIQASCVPQPQIHRRLKKKLYFRKERMYHRLWFSCYFLEMFSMHVTKLLILCSLMKSREIYNENKIRIWTTYIIGDVIDRSSVNKLTQVKRFADSIIANFWINLVL